uniref:Uncharacterized protein n=1 Tax=Anopheles melas TaxID=34690 RepID=A0A182TS09_9DIPT
MTGSANINNINNNISGGNNNNGNSIQERNNNNNSNHSNNADSARILSEKNALEKNLKKHSLFINALSWKRLAASHGKKKLDNNKNNGAGTQSVVGLVGSSGGAAVGLADRPPHHQQQQSHHLHPHGQMVVAQQQQQQQQQQQAVYFTPRGPKALLALDLVRANNTNPLSQPDKLAQKLPLQLPMPLQPIVNQQQQHNVPMGQQLHHGHGPRKTVIQFPLFVSVPVVVAYERMHLVTFHPKPRPCVVQRARTNVPQTFSMPPKGRLTQPGAINLICAATRSRSATRTTITKISRIGNRIVAEQPERSDLEE